VPADLADFLIDHGSSPLVKSCWGIIAHSTRKIQQKIREEHRSSL